MKTNEIKAKIEKLQAEQAATARLEKDYPSSLPEIDFLFWHNSNLCEFSVSHKVKDLEEAKIKIMQYQDYILPLELSKGTFTTFRTPEHKPERGQKESRPVFPVTVKVSKYNLTFEFYAIVEGHLLSVDVEFEFQSGFERFARVMWKSHANNYGEKWVTDVRLSTPAFVGYKYIKWATGREYPNDFTLYWENVERLDQIFA